ncbi:MAG: hypothetical protein ACQESR_06130 [Planctomycetota bacterium]
MESCPARAVRPLFGLAAEKVIRDRYNTIANDAHWLGNSRHGRPARDRLGSIAACVTLAHRRCIRLTVEGGPAGKISGWANT